MSSAEERRLTMSRIWIEMKKQHSMPSSSLLMSMVLPWTVLIIVAICGVILGNDNNSDNDNNDNELFSFEILPSQIHRFLSQDHEHSPLFPLDNSDYIGVCCATIGLMIAAGGGIGGGGILVPILILVMGFSPKHAIPLSNVTVLGGAIANTLLNSRKRHPHADRPLVDWDLILVMEPLTIAGALVGAFLNKLLPEQLLAIMLVILLSFTAYNTLKKAIKMYKIETKLLQQQQINSNESELTRMAKQQHNDDDDHDHDDDDDDLATESLLQNMELQEGEEFPAIVNKNSNEEELKALLKEESTTPIPNIKMLVIMFIVVLIINVLKGGGAFRSPLGIRCGSTSFWAANLLNFLWIFAVSLYARSYLIKRYHLKARLQYKYVEGDIQWDDRATIVYPIICCLAGFFAGMFGVGGGIVKGPLMLAMGVHPAVSSASSACMILFTSFTATTSFVVFGLLVPDYAFVCVIVGFLATLVGQIGLGILMKKYQRNSYIAFSIGGVVLLSAFLMTIQSLVSMTESKHHHTGGICGRDE